MPAVAVTRNTFPDLLQLAANQIRRAQVLKTTVRQRLSLQLRPIVILNTARLQAGAARRLPHR